MYLVLGSGLNGLLLAHRLRSIGRPFVILGEGLLTSNNRKGFFYSHTPNPFTHEKSYPVNGGACPGGSAELYCKKVYGISPSSRISYDKYAKGGLIGEGWSYDPEKLCDGIIDGENFFKDMVREIADSHIGTVKGRYWGRSKLKILNTIPLPNLLELIDPDIYSQEYEDYLESKPIFVEEVWGNSHVERGINVHYCALDCHKWYRQTEITMGVGADLIQYREYSEPPEVKHHVLKPGKIWYRDEPQEKMIQDLVDLLVSEENIWCFGRYAQWKPKLLSSHVWEESNRLLFI